MKVDDPSISLCISEPCSQVDSQRYQVRFAFFSALNMSAEMIAAPHE